VISLARAIATLGGIGRLPASGTFGSLVAVPTAWGIVWLGGVWSLAAATLLVTLVGIWAGGLVVRDMGREDPGEIVIDEVAGQWLTLLVAPLDPLAYAAGFALFRVFDILKPWPVSWADASLTGGFGVMADDLLAGLYAALGVFLMLRFGLF
jgi:phosphatidylglycerophosphatase A